MIQAHVLLKAGILVFGTALLLAQRGRAGTKVPRGLVRGGIAALAGVNFLLLAALVASHLRSPFENEIMEFAVLQHAARFLHGLPIYPPPGPDFVALAYNPLYYVIAAPFLATLGENLFALRLLSLIAYAACLVVVFLAVRDRTRSGWWGLVAAGLFAGAYKAMDAYLDTAHTDGWMLLCLLLGAWTLDRARGAAGRLGGTLLLVLAFWFKQHGALFALGGVAFLTLRDGWRRAVPAWLLLLVTGPVLYAGGNALFGPAFHDFTWSVPNRWSVYDIHMVGRLITFVTLWYAVLAVVAALSWFDRLRAGPRRMDAWTFLLAPAVLTGLMGTLDAGSSNNVFIPMGTWFIVVGVMAMARSAREWAGDLRFEASLLVISFALLAYNPMPLVVPSRAIAAQADLFRFLHGLPGTVYAPWIGQLPSGYRFEPAAHLVSVEDWIGARGDGSEPILRTMMAPALGPADDAWVLANTRLETYACLEPLQGRYRLAQDLGDRFVALRCLPRRWFQAYPRYLYRFEAERVTPVDSAGARPGADHPGSRSYRGGQRWSAANVRPPGSATAPAAHP